MEREATPIRRIHVSEQGRFGTARIDAAEQGLEALGYVLPNRVIGAALWEGLRALPERRGDRPGARDRQRRSRATDGCCAFERDGDGAGAWPRAWWWRRTARSRWCASRPASRPTTGRTARPRSSPPITTQRFHDHVAYERFTPEGPIAVLPLAEGRCGIVWTRRPEEAARLLALPDAEFLAELQRAFGFRLGRVLQVGARHSYELGLARTDAATWPTGSPWSATPRRRCTRSPGRASTSGCAMRRASPR